MYTKTISAYGEITSVCAELARLSGFHDLSEFTASDPSTIAWDDEHRIAAWKRLARAYELFQCTEWTVRNLFEGIGSWGIDSILPPHEVIDARERLEPMRRMVMHLDLRERVRRHRDEWSPVFERAASEASLMEYLSSEGPNVMSVFIAAAFSRHWAAETNVVAGKSQDSVKRLSPSDYSWFRLHILNTEEARAIEEMIWSTARDSLGYDYEREIMEEIAESPEHRSGYAEYDESLYEYAPDRFPTLTWELDHLQFELPGRNPISEGARHTLRVAMSHYRDALEERGDLEPGGDDDSLSAADSMLADDALWEVLGKPAFRPASWVSNSKTIGPIKVRDQRRFNRSMRQYLEQIVRSYIFGQWLASIALSRAMLEKAVSDFVRSERRKKDPNARIDERERLADLIEEVSQGLSSDVSTKLGILKNQADRVLHFRRESPIRDVLIYAEEEFRVFAMTHIRETLDCVAALYSRDA
jgi:hypothetical protein